MRGCLIGCLTLVVFSFSGASVSLDNNLASARMNALSLAPSGTVTIVTIDAESISKAGEWPWPRERFAQALDNLNAAGAGMIALDVDFSARSSPEGDAALVQAVQDNAGWIALPYGSPNMSSAVSRFVLCPAGFPPAGLQAVKYSIW